MEHFNSPPGWPRPPWNWRPEPGWRPDPSWPAPPQGWNFWVDDYGYPTAGPRGLFGTEAPDSSNSATRALPLSEPSATANRSRSAPAGGNSNAKTGVGCVIIGVLLLALMGGCISLFKGDDGSNDPGTSSSPSSSTSSSSSEESSPSDSSSSDSSSSSTSSSNSTATDNGDDNRTSTPAPSSTTTDSVPEPSETRTSTPLPDPTTTSQQPQYLVSPTTQQPTQGGGGSADYPNCAAVRAAGAAPIHAGEPGYSLKLDRDGDGVACE